METREKRETQLAVAEALAREREQQGRKSARPQNLAVLVLTQGY